MSDINSGYKSSENDWSIFLYCWREAVKKRLNDKGRLNSFPSDVNKISLSATVEYENNKDAVLKIEEKYKMKLPKSYRDFVLITGGNWLVEVTGFLENDHLHSNFVEISKIGKFKDVDQLNWGGWNKAMNGEKIPETLPEQYYRYGYYNTPSQRQDDSQFRWEYIDGLIKVGELWQGDVVLLNPYEITSDGEWEAWRLSSKSGADRYRSFAELMQALAYRDIFETGAPFLPANELRATCAGHLKTAATE